MLGTKCAQNKFAENARVIVESAGRNLSAKRQVMGDVSVSGPDCESIPDAHSLPMLKRHSISFSVQRRSLVVVVPFRSLDLQADPLRTHTVYVLLHFASYATFFGTFFDTPIRLWQPVRAIMSDAR